MVSTDATAAERELTLTPEQALQLAIERHRAGELDDAETLYRVLLERWPDHADVLNHMGVLQHQRGDHARALARKTDDATHTGPGAGRRQSASVPSSSDQGCCSPQTGPGSR